ncbi:MAG: Ig-like domain-containing protein [Polyangia bacterium]|jgi:hypothetical protein|nr:Ig-like domain-containing protein [Polyangia bacterium]
MTRLGFMGRNGFAAAGIFALLLMGACGGKSSAGDPDSGTNNNQNNNQTPECGNDLFEAGEECDGSDLGRATCESLNLGSGDLACTSDCIFDVTGCSEQAECGNDLLEYPETCDGSDLGGLSCDSLGFVGGTLLCSVDCEPDTSQCETCGNGAIDGDEQCDGGELGGASCASLGLGTGDLACGAECLFDTSGCSVQPVCSDGVAQGAELCDGDDLRSQTCASLGYGTGDLGCTGDCAWDLSGCQWCGNGVADTDEDCEGEDLKESDCTDAGFDGGTLACAQNCVFDTSLCHNCGASDTTAPTSSNHVPAPETLGAPGDTVIAVDLYDACGVDPDAISMRITIQPKMGPAQVLSVTPTVTGSGTNVTASYQHPSDFPAGAVVTVLLAAADMNTNTLTETWRFSIRDRMSLYTSSSGVGPMVNAIDQAHPDTNYSGFTDSFLVGGAAGYEVRMLIRFAPAVPAGPIFAGRLDLGICPPWPPTTPVVTSIECFRLNVDSAANQATWNLRRTNPSEVAWGSPGANAVPGDRQGVAAATMDPGTASSAYTYVSDDVLPLLLEWQGGAGYHGILCTVPVGQVPICGSYGNLPPLIELEYGPSLP